MRHDRVVPSAGVLGIVRVLALQVLITPGEAGYQLYFASLAAVPKGTMNNSFHAALHFRPKKLKMFFKKFPFSVL